MEQTFTAPDLIICPLFRNERQIGGHGLMASGKVRVRQPFDFPETDGAVPVNAPHMPVECPSAIQFLAIGWRLPLCNLSPEN